MHVLKKTAFGLLHRARLLTYDGYTAEDGYMITTVAGDRREVGSREAAAYLLGMHDLFQGVRQAVDEVAGDDALARLDERFQDVLAAASGPFEPEEDAR